MFAYRTIWEDAEKNREIVFDIGYTVADGQATIIEIDARRVNLLDESRQVRKTLRVHTATGRRLLASHLLARGKAAAQLTEEVLAQHNWEDARSTVA